MNSIPINTIAVLGAGVMGAQIAAMFVNLNFKVILFDVRIGEKNISKQALDNLLSLKPKPLADVSLLNNIKAASYELDLDLIKQCDLIVETVADNLKWKKNLYNKIKSYINQQAILVSNSHSLTITDLVVDIPNELKPRFLGMHFYYPPTFMKLIEISFHADTSTKSLDIIKNFIRNGLDKEFIVAKDRPFFIGYRVGMFNLLNTIRHAHKYSLTPDCVDLITGEINDGSKLGTFKTIDLIGLDNFSRIVTGMHAKLLDDPWRSMFVMPDYMTEMISQGSLGQKSEQGFYRTKNGETQSLDQFHGVYKSKQFVIDKSFYEILNLPWPKKFKQLRESEHPYGKFLFSCYRDLFHYVSFHLKEIAYTVQDIDLAMKLGFSWLKGPFEIWQECGWHNVAKQLSNEIESKKTFVGSAVPSWALKATFQGGYHKNKIYSVEKDDYISKI
jgi:3-hydroxyacyl-CoA dehydrogenase